MLPLLRWRVFSNTQEGGTFKRLASSSGARISAGTMALFSAMQACARGVFGAAKVELLKHHAIINPASLTASPVESRPLSEWRRIGTLFRLKRILGGAERRATGEVQSKSSPFQTLRSHRLLFRTIMRQQKFPAGSVQAIAGLWRRRQEGISARRSDEDGYLPPCKPPPYHHHQVSRRFDNARWFARSLG